jgi:hypothetical protein
LLAKQQHHTTYNSSQFHHQNFKTEQKPSNGALKEKLVTDQDPLNHHYKTTKNDREIA